MPDYKCIIACFISSSCESNSNENDTKFRHSARFDLCAIMRFQYWTNSKNLWTPYFWRPAAVMVNVFSPFSPWPVIGSAAGLQPSQNLYSRDRVFWEILAERRNAINASGYSSDLFYNTQNELKLLTAAPMQSLCYFYFFITKVQRRFKSISVLGLVNRKRKWLSETGEEKKLGTNSYQFNKQPCEKVFKVLENLEQYFTVSSRETLNKS